MEFKSRLATLRNKTIKNIASKRQEKSVLSEARIKSIPPAIDSSKILNGVVACLDVRTDDGSDCSLNFERSLQSMGAKTRKTFGDSVTHLVFKNGAPATLKKALLKKVFIINCLWVSQCKREGKRLPETDFSIDKPQVLALTGKRKRKSMEPGTVRALDEMEPGIVKALDELEPSSSTSSSEELVEQVKEEEDIIPSIIDWKSRKRATMSESEMRRRHIAEAEAAEENGDSKPPRLSLPVSLERPKQTKPVNNIIPIHAPSTEKQEEIKARFSIGKVDTPARSFTTPNTASPPLLKRKRRLTGNMSRPPMFSSASSKTK